MFNATEQANNVCEWLWSEYDTNNREFGRNKFVVPVSGGIESAVMAAICVKVLGKRHTVLVNVPYGLDPESAMAATLQYHLGTEMIQVNCRKPVDDITSGIKDGNTVFVKGFAVWDKESVITDVRNSIINMTAREVNGIICNSISLSKAYLESPPMVRGEKGELFPLLMYTHNEIIQMGMTLEMPESLLFSISSQPSPFERRNKINFSLLDNYLRGIPCGISDEGAMFIEKLHITNGFTLRDYRINCAPHGTAESKWMELN